MLLLSQIIIQHPEVNSFAELKKLVGQMGADGQVLLSFDLKPDFRDTPRDWEPQLEYAFLWDGKEVFRKKT